MPVFMVASSSALIALVLEDRDFSFGLFRALWAVNLGTYLLVTLSSFSLDPQTARACWRQGFAFPGLISLAIILYTLDPSFQPLAADLVSIDPGTGSSSARRVRLG